MKIATIYPGSEAATEGELVVVGVDRCDTVAGNTALRDVVLAREEEVGSFFPESSTNRQGSPVVDDSVSETTTFVDDPGGEFACDGSEASEGGFDWSVSSACGEGVVNVSWAPGEHSGFAVQTASYSNGDTTVVNTFTFLAEQWRFYSELALTVFCVGVWDSSGRRLLAGCSSLTALVGQYAFRVVALTQADEVGCDTYERLRHAFWPVVAGPFACSVCGATFEGGRLLAGVVEREKDASGARELLLEHRGLEFGVPRRNEGFVLSSALGGLFWPGFASRETSVSSLADVVALTPLLRMSSGICSICARALSGLYYRCGASQIHMCCRCFGHLGWYGLVCGGEDTGLHIAEASCQRSAACVVGVHVDGAGPGRDVAFPVRVLVGSVVQRMGVQVPALVYSPGCCVRSSCGCGRSAKLVHSRYTLYLRVVLRCAYCSALVRGYFCSACVRLPGVTLVTDDGRSSGARYLC